MTHLYCLLAAHVRSSMPPGLTGLSGAPVRALSVSDFVAWVSDVDRGLPLTVDGVRTHDGVVEAALSTGATPIPARYGQRFADDEACVGALRSRADSISSLLTSVHELVEMTLIVTPSTSRMVRELQPVVPEMFDPATAGAGRRYLETLRRRETVSGAIQRLSDELVEHLAAAAEPFVRRAVQHAPVTPIPLRTISHLIPRSTVADYRRAIDAVKTGSSRRVLVIGPRAPYSFCALGTEPAGAHGMNLAD